MRGFLVLVRFRESGQVHKEETIAQLRVVVRILVIGAVKTARIGPHCTGLHSSVILSCSIIVLGGIQEFVEVLRVPGV